MTRTSRRWLVRVEIKSVIVSAVSRITANLRFDRPGPGRQIVFVHEFRPEPFKFRVIPEHVGLFIEVDTAGETLLDQKRFPDLFQHRGFRARRQAPFDKCGGHRLDFIESGRNAPFVIGKGDGYRERLAYEQEPVLIGALELNRARFA